MLKSISERAEAFVIDAERKCHDAFDRIDGIELENQIRILRAFSNSNVSYRHFTPSTGYGYGDIARDTLDILFADAFQAESALVRPSIVNGTHAIYLAVSGIARPGDTIFSITGKPYDTLETAFGLQGASDQSLKKFGIGYHQIELTEQGTIDEEMIERELQPSDRIFYIQRSRGYSWRNSLGRNELEDVFSLIRYLKKDAVIIVDNCYCEFCDYDEPTGYGADIIAGSLIKNPGGGLVPTGGYIAGKSEYVNEIAQRLTVPGLGGEVGSYSGDYRPYYQGLFMAPHTVNQSLKTAILFSCVLQRLGFEILPKVDDFRNDVVQSVKLRTPENLEKFCRIIQAVSPVDSNVTPEAWDMPGYSDPVIMAAGTFVQGATSEISADGPMRDPYIAYLQGSLTYTHGKIAAMYVCDALM